MRHKLESYDIALCFYGEARNWQNNAAENIKQFNKLSQERFNIDVYFHLWDDITRRLHQGKDLVKLIKDNSNIDDICVVESNLQHKELLKSFNPINYKIENKNVLDQYIDKFNPSNKHMSCEEIKRAIKCSNSPPFSQFYSMSQSFDVIENKNKYHLIIMVKTDYLFTDKSITEKTLRFYCEYITERNSLLVERMSFVPQRKEVWLYHGYMLGNSIVYKDIFDNFPKIPVGMGVSPLARCTWKGSSHAELADYILNHTNVFRVWPILHQSFPHFVGKCDQFHEKPRNFIQEKIQT